MRNLFLLLVLATLAFAGCSKNVGLKGTVKFDDGQPVPSGIVCFVTDSYMARGNIVNGEFKMSSTKEGDGLPPGDYKVYFTGIEVPVGESVETADGGMSEPTMVSAIAPKYDSADTSELTQKVDASTKTIEFTLERNPNL